MFFLIAGRATSISKNMTEAQFSTLNNLTPAYLHLTMEISSQPSPYKAYGYILSILI
jgi:hypothetical protein